MENNIDRNKLLKLKYYSQYLDLDDKMDALTSCGMTCVKMLLEYKNIHTEKLCIMVRRGKGEGGYGPSGWIHDYFVSMLNSYNLNSHREEKMDTKKALHDFKISIDNDNPIICSVEQRIFDRKLFHMILIIGYKYDKDNNIIGLYYNDPASTSIENGENKYVTVADFIPYFRNMAIFINTKN